MSERVVVTGAGGFIGGHLVKRLLEDGHQVRAVDRKSHPEWWQLHPHAENLTLDLRHPAAARRAVANSTMVYNLAADMGGMGFIERNKALCMLSVLINANLLDAVRRSTVERYFYSSSACVYAAARQDSPGVRALREEDAYPADPEDGYGWEKLFSERMCRHYAEDFGITTRVARYHNAYGPQGTWEGGREKAPAAICRKVAEAVLSGRRNIEIWGDGEQTRSFMYVDDCVKGTILIANSGIQEPINLGSRETVTINELADIVEDISGWTIGRRHDLSAPQGVRGRSSDNALCRRLLGWEPSIPLREGLERTYAWIYNQVLATC